ncbi:TorF family putative porin [Arenibaculum pallidiluteum]|uniref:TorF family putative porin n=1 Tax=Arenibaculum pallidiluteum TaxID=2812559 RepID=UPI001A959BA2|nr:TorF family putative porin [Arenibaculum pallidiluteum]
MIKHISAALLCACVAASNASAAEDGGSYFGTFSGNAALATEYVARGISQTGVRPTFQGGLDWKYEADGITPYVGGWASKVDGEGALGIPGANYELDLYAGTVFSFGGADLDLGATRYVYPGENASGYDPSYWETKVGLSYTIGDFAQPALTYNYTPDYSGTGFVGHYVKAELTIAPPELPLGLFFNGSFGRSMFSGDTMLDYNDWSLGAGVQIDGATITLIYTDTDIGKDSCPKFCDSRVVGTVQFVF